MSKARDIASAAPAPSTVSATELGYVDGVTSAIQTQLDAKTAKSTLTTTGDIYYASAANTPARLGIGSTGNVLTVASGIPSWSTPAGGGKILQVVSGSYSTYASTSSTSFVDINAALNLSLTCATTSSRVLVLAHFNELYVSVDSRDIKIGITAAGSIIQKAEAVLLGSSGENLLNQDLMIVHSPASTSAVEYKMQFASRTGGSIEVNQNGSTGGCTLTLMEIGA
jgi:hypothetical protein